MRVGEAGGGGGQRPGSQIRGLSQYPRGQQEREEGFEVVCV